MPYARINMAEFTSSAEAERTIAILRNDIKSVSPEIRAFACVETTETSALTISIYYDKEAADRAAAHQSVVADISPLSCCMLAAPRKRPGPACGR